MFRFLRMRRGRIKTCGLSYETSLLFSSSCPLFWKDARAFADHDTRRFLIRTSVRANGHAPAHRALREFAIPAFTLHLHPQFIDPVCFAGEGNALFQPSPVKETKVKPSLASRCFRSSYSRTVKRWRQKRKTADARNACALEVEVEGKYTFEKGLLVVGALQV